MTGALKTHHPHVELAHHWEGELSRQKSQGLQPDRSDASHWVQGTPGPRSLGFLTRNCSSSASACLVGDMSVKVLAQHLACT